MCGNKDFSAFPRGSLQQVVSPCPAFQEREGGCLLLLVPFRLEAAAESSAGLPAAAHQGAGSSPPSDMAGSESHPTF